MQSTKKTTVAVLRNEIGLSVEQFAALIGRSVSAVNSLETGRLALGEETAFTIQEQTGVEMTWLLSGKSKEPPYIFDQFGEEHLYTKEVFELIQAQKATGIAPKERAPWRLVGAMAIASDWLSVYNHAVKAGRGPLASYLMQRFLDGLVERLGQDNDAFMRLNKKARIITADGSEWSFDQNIETGRITLSKPVKDLEELAENAKVEELEENLLRDRPIKKAKN
jgi:transcriptional regulator with XRE-family HTH domain